MAISVVHILMANIASHFQLPNRKTHSGKADRVRYVRMAKCVSHFRRAMLATLKWQTVSDSG
jgi:hypothetical protein